MTKSLADKKFDIIYADPPWSYYNDMSVNPDCTTIKGMHRPPYPVLSIKDICSFPVKDLAKDNCILFIWTTDYHLGRCISEVIPAWGFEYKTIGFVWAKKNKQGNQVSFMGAYTKKSGCELCLIATKGKDAHKLVVNHKINSFIEYPRQEHSKKPDLVRKAIEELCGPRDRIELFAREFFDGWVVLGNEIDGKDIREVLYDKDTN